MTATLREQLGDLIAPLRVAPGQSVSLPGDFDPGFTGPFAARDDARELEDHCSDALREYQARLAAQDTWSLLVVFQALDAAGKDGTIAHVMKGVNPQGVSVSSFKAPSGEELDHDYLWRVARRLPARGSIGIFNRSHYEEVLVVRVHPQFLDAQKLPPTARGEDIWQRRFRQINDWERHLAENGTRIVKLFLNVSREEQRQRFLSRTEEPHKHWKFSAGDVRERRFWADYQAAFADMLSHTSTEHAPWYVIPADRKWFMRLASAAVIADTLMDIDPQWPIMGPEALTEMQAAREELLAEA